MTKTLADTMVKGAADDMSKVVGSLLVRPGDNHSNTFHPMVERFVFDSDVWKELWPRWNDAPDETFRRATVAAYRAPLLGSWIEIDGLIGYFIGSDETVCAFGKHADGRALSLGAFTPASLDAGHVWPDVLSDDEVRATIGMFYMLCACINSPRAATVERIVPKSGRTGAERAFQRRQAQRGAPMYSFNRVTLNRPQISIQRSEIVDAGGKGPKRGHWVIGHWRLVEGRAEPYWTWVDAHRRGDDELGEVCKERLVKLAADASPGRRRGFFVPIRSGCPGEHIPAMRA